MGGGKSERALSYRSSSKTNGKKVKSRRPSTSKSSGKSKSSTKRIQLSPSSTRSSSKKSSTSSPRVIRGAVDMQTPESLKKSKIRKQKKSKVPRMYLNDEDRMEKRTLRRNQRASAAQKRQPVQSMQVSNPQRSLRELRMMRARIDAMMNSLNNGR